LTEIGPVGTALIYVGVRADGWNDRHDTANGRCLRICERA